MRAELLTGDEAEKLVIDYMGQEGDTRST